MEAGDSVELCGGTHVRATGDIGLIKIVQEGSIGSNLRRIEAVTGQNAVDYVINSSRTLTCASEMLGTSPDGLVDSITRKIAEVKELNDELKTLRTAGARARAGEIVLRRKKGVVVERVDGLTPGDLRELAIAVRSNTAVKVVVLGRNYNSINSYRIIIIVIFNRNLTFGIRTKIFQFLSCTTSI